MISSEGEASKIQDNFSSYSLHTMYYTGLNTKVLALLCFDVSSQ
ncbi:hypothetical protein QE390_004682 [Siphonobacter sp. SORGH_AS 1065]|nr:hypothetical protein [Siphonobacter sp. SORGH_AS_1065]